MEQKHHDFDFNTASWDVIYKYFSVNKGYQLVKHQIESFNDFVLRKLDQIIEGFNIIEVPHQYIPEKELFKYVLILEVTNPIVNKPIIYEKDGSTKVMTPNDARQRNFTYASNLTVDINVRAKTYNEELDQYVEETKSINGVPLGKIPIMVKSNYCVLKNIHTKNNQECRYDYGGYFIINGNEKVIISQDRISENKTFVFTNNKVSTYSHIAEIRSVQENKLGVPKITTIKLAAKANQFGRYMRINIHHIKTDIPLFILFKALGLETDRSIIEHIVYDINDKTNMILINELTACIEEANAIMCQKDALEYLAKYLNITGYPKEILYNKNHRINIVRAVLEKEFLPHVGREFEKKRVYLGYMVNKLLKCVLGLKPYDDRDSYINKKVDSPGVLMANLFRQYYGKVIKDMKNMLQKEINSGGWKATGKFINVINKINITKLFKSTIIDSGMRYALATGNWGIKSNKNKQGVAQVLNRMTYNSTLSHLRRINTPIEKSGKLVQPRKLHSTQWGIICPCECFDPDTPILMWDGTIKLAKDIDVGDYLIDDKGNSVRVKSTCSGYKNMYEVVPEKKNFASHTVTDNHILTLKVRNHTRNPNKSNKKYKFRWFDKDTLTYKYASFDCKEELETFQSKIDDVIDITIEKYLSLPTNIQKELYIFKSDGINWEFKEVALDPYILGMWLGDGFSTGYGFATADKELLDEWIKWGADNDATITKGLKYKYGISSTINNTQEGIACNKTEKAPLKKLLAKYNLVNNKHIPLDYLVNDRKTRLAVLAGLVDTDGNVRANGHEIRICQGEKNYQIIYDAEFLARSLGFSCHLNDGICTYTVDGEKRYRPYKELTITGANLYEIPTVLPRKKLNKFERLTSIKKCASHMQSSFKLEEKDIRPFVGWQLEGNGRFLLADMTTVHNTPEGSSVGLVKNMSVMTSITICSNSENLKKVLEANGLETFDASNIAEFYKKTKVFLNGDIIGFHSTPNELYNTLKDMKRSGCINVYTSIVWNVCENEIVVCSEGGRCVRPLFIVDVENKRLSLEDFDIKKGYDWYDMVIGRDGGKPVVEFLDVEEMNSVMIAMKYEDIKKGVKGSLLPIRYTHLEIHPIAILGVAAANIPFPDHNQAPRNCYQCLWEEEEVLMVNGDKKKIKDVNVGDKVVTFDPHTMAPSVSTVVNQFVKKTDKKIYRITTVSGRTITATYDHLFMTNKGWVQAENLQHDQNLKVGVYMGASTIVSSEVDDYTIMDENYFRDQLVQYNIAASKINQYITHLKSIELLPLKSTNKNLPIIARICGFILTDGSLNIYKRRGYEECQCQADFGDLISAQCFEDDLKYLGFQTTKISESYMEGYGHTFKVCHGGVLPAYLIALGISFGKKTETPRSAVPDWIMNGSLHVQREFVAGFQGGDGCQIRWNKFKKCGYNFVCAETSQQINPKYLTSLVHFFEQIKTIFDRLGIETKNIMQKHMEENRIKVAIKIRDTHSNLIKYFTTIGYRYDTRKATNSGKVIEYLKFKQITNDLHISKIKKLRELYDQNKSTSEIAQILDMRVNRVADHIRSYKAKRTISPPNQRDTVDKWTECLESNAFTVFVPIKSIEEVPNCMIADITVDSDNHSFIAGDNFQVHNSSMCKQAIGIYASNYRERFDTLAHVLDYGQKPLVRTKMAKILNSDNLPNGVNAVVAIMTYTGYNQEDSVILNKSAVERGMFTSTYYRTYKEQNNKNHSNGEEEFFTKPKNINKNNKPYNYDKINEDGFVPENTYVEPGDIIIGKCMPNKVDNAIVYKDNSVALKNNEKGVVDRNCYNDKHFINVNGDGYNFAKIRLRNVRTPVIGDKFACFDVKNTEVLTTKGWKFYKELNGDFEVAILKDGKLVYEKPEAVHYYPEFKGEMYHISNQGIDLDVTMNHRMFVSMRKFEKIGPKKYKDVWGDYEFAYAKDIVGKRVRYKKDAEWECEDYQFVLPGDPNRIIDMDSWLTFFGIWIAEGYVEKNGNDVCIAANKPRVKTALKKCMMNLTDKEVKFLKADKYRFADAHINQYLRQFGKAIEKYLPDWVWQLSKRQANILLDGLMCGDGYKNKSGGEHYYTSSVKLKDDVQRLCLHAGYAADVMKRYDAGHTTNTSDGRTITTNADSWVVMIHKKRLNPTVNHGHTKDQEVQNEYTYYSEEPVFCLTVSSGVFMVRRNGKPVWSGNSRMAQKGTMGISYRQEEMPFTKDGIVPDIIMNPNAIPSRMTIGQLMECIMGKACAINGTYGDSTPFTDLSVEEISEVLAGHGLEKYGNEVMHDPRTGQQIQCDIFIGPTFYQRLKHMTADKVHSRASSGPIVLLTRQPADGRSREGGLRLGEMEVEVHWAHGINQFLKERMMECSDNYRIHVCKQCGFQAIANPEKNLFMCKNCKNITNFSEIRIPYSAKLLFQEIGTMSVGVKFIT
jgi:DNA-directed RNA polymerase beta subunit